jgi:drug/metabolite transporter (DMT)-like permease
MLVWAAMYPLTKVVVRSVHPVTVAGIRYVLGSLPLLPFFAAEVRRRRPAISFKDGLVMCLLGILGITLFSACLTLGIQRSTASNSALLVNTQPILTVLLAPLLIDERYSWRRIAGALVGLAGIYLIVSGGRILSDILAYEYLLGNLLLLGASLLFSLYSILLKGYLGRYGGLIPTFFSMTAGTAILLLFIAATGTGSRLGAITPRDWLLLAYIGIVATAIGYLVLNTGIRHVGVVRAVGFKFLIPVFGIALSVAFLGERFTPVDAGGAALVFAALYLTQSRRPRRPSWPPCGERSRRRGLRGGREPSPGRFEDRGPT